MESRGSRLSLRTRHSSGSSSLSELDDNYLEKIMPESSNAFHRGTIRSKQDIKPPDRNTPAATGIEKRSATKLQRKPSNERMVTVIIGGKKCILPYEFLPVDGLTEWTHAKDTSNCPPEGGGGWWDAKYRQEIVSLCPVEQEVVLKRKNLCGDFSFAKSKESTSKSSGQVGHSELRNGATRKSKSRTSFLEMDFGGEADVKTAKELKVKRHPVECPISRCRDFVCAAFFSSHMKVQHCRVLLEGFVPGQSRTILVDARLNECGENHCNVVYYMKNKLRDFGQSEFKNILPVLLMSSKFSFVDLELHRDDACADLKRACTGGHQHHQYIYWLTGIVSGCLRTHYTLEVGSCKLQSGWIYPLGQSQDLKSVYQSGAGMILSQDQLVKLTRRKDQLLEMRLVLN